MSLSEEEQSAEWKSIGDKYRERRRKELAAEKAARDEAGAMEAKENALLLKEQKLVEVAKACGVQAWDRYQDYLKSRIWKQKREAVLARSGGRCEVSSCQSPSRDVHHLIYPSTWGTEPVDVLKALCQHHHAVAHDDNGGYAVNLALLEQIKSERAPR